MKGWKEPARREHKKRWGKGVDGGRAENRAQGQSPAFLAACF